MASLINRIQRAFLGSAGDEKVRALLAELQIPAGGSGGTIREARRGFLRPISDEAILRDALANLGLSGGGGGGAQALSSIRTAILHNLRDSETTLRDGLNDLLAPDDLGAEGGGTPAPEWVPADAKIYIDLVGGDPQGRAWVAGTGEVAVDTLLGSDPNTDEAWGTSLYDDSKLQADGYVTDGNDAPALIGSALSNILAAATIVIRTKRVSDNFGFTPLVVMSADGNDAVEMDLNGGGDVSGSSYGGSFSASILGVVTVGAGTFNVAAMTLTSSRFDVAVNGSAAVAGVLASDDRPTGNPFVAAMVDPNAANAIQSITLYDPLPNTIGLSELSAVA